MKTKIKSLILIGLLLSISLLACEPLGVPPDWVELGITNTQFDSTPPPFEVTPSPSQSSSVGTQTATLPNVQPEPEERMASLWVDPDLPVEISDKLQIPDSFVLEKDPAKADFLLGFDLEIELSHWFYALVAPFMTLDDSLYLADFKSFWAGSLDFPVHSLAMDVKTLSAMKHLFGEPKASISVIKTDEISEVFKESERVWAVVPFHLLEPVWKVIEMDGQSPIRKDFVPEAYALKSTIGLRRAFESGTDSPYLVSALEEMEQNLSAVLPKSNRDETKLATVVMTGVTALVRATASEMEVKGILFPAEDVGPLMREADITHVSNEVPFYDQCPFPTWVQAGVKFCSSPRYLDLLLEIGTDVIDLTGDHFNDYGQEAMLQTLDLYNKNDLPYFGGGRDIEDAITPLKLEVNGNKIAFLGCNAKGPGFATASATYPGAYYCNMNDMVERVEKLVQEGYMPIVTFQHYEYYHWGIAPELARDFRAVAEAGAVIVSGSQAHQPHAFEFYEGQFLHYGLGNLFFDQLQLTEDTTKAFIDRYVFYDGKLMSIELFTLRFFDWSKPSLVEGEMREEMLRRLFEFSLWE